MFFRARRSLQRAWFNFRCRGLLQTPPLFSPDATVSVVTMLCHGEVRMYLLAVKSFAKHLGFTPSVVVLNDGSLDEADISLLRSHIPFIRLVSMSAVDTGACPKGNCWERLTLISDLVQQSYIVQLDSDTLTRLPVPEVLDCITSNRSFTLLGDRSYPNVEPMLSSWERLKDSSSTQVQAVCERAFNKLPESQELLYLRGNAGFVGFAKGSISRDRIQYFSDRMRRLCGARWDEWGSEQLASNLLIANSEDPLPLPPPRYVSYWAHPDIPYGQSAFIHFIGPHRFSNGLYIHSARQVIKALK